jgi:1,4-dihydroxy-6-naphthoate synthase
MVDQRPVLRIGHSPDPDDAFMWWPLLHTSLGPPRLDTGRFRFEAVQEDIEALNERSESGELEITAMSCAQYPAVQDIYAITACGASMGDAYGPKLVTRTAMTLQELAESHPTILIPGVRTSAFGALSLALGPGSFEHVVAPFDEIIDRMATGAFDAGVVIHEGQLTYAEAGLHLVADLGAWWHERTGMLLPLGINTVRRDLEDAFGPGTLEEVTGLLLTSVRYAMEHREESLQFALQFARGIDPAVADEFVAMYVNRWTLNFGDQGESAVRWFLGELAEAGLARVIGRPDFVKARTDRSNA